MDADIISLAACCTRCGFVARAMAGPGVAAFYPDRREWLARCWHCPKSRTPMACNELWQAAIHSSKARQRKAG